MEVRFFWMLKCLVEGMMLAYARTLCGYEYKLIELLRS